MLMTLIAILVLLGAAGGHWVSRYVAPQWHWKLILLGALVGIPVGFITWLMLIVLKTALSIMFYLVIAVAILAALVFLVWKLRNLNNR
jgi:hypothetical protein